MKELRIINNFFRKRICNFDLVSDNEAFKIKIEIPCLKNNSYQVVGKSDREYIVTMEDNQAIELSYLNLHHSEIKKVSLKLKNLYFLSPFLEIEKRAFPFFINLFDKENGFVFHLYLDKNGEFSRSEVLKIADGIESLKTEVSLKGLRIAV